MVTGLLHASRAVLELRLGLLFCFVLFVFCFCLFCCVFFVFFLGGGVVVFVYLKWHIHDKYRVICRTLERGNLKAVFEFLDRPEYEPCLLFIYKQDAVASCTIPELRLLLFG